MVRTVFSKDEAKTPGKIIRVPSGIKGLDSITQGGLVKGSTTLVSGYAGTGKSIFCCQFLMEGLLKGEKCMLVTFEESPDDLRADAMAFGWDLGKYENKGLLSIGYRPPLKSEELYFFSNEIRKYKVDRVALDSTSVLAMSCKNDFEIRRELFKLVEVLKRSGATSLLTAEMVAGKDGVISRFGIEEFVVDSVIVPAQIDLRGVNSSRA